MKMRSISGQLAARRMTASMNAVAVRAILTTGALLLLALAAMPAAHAVDEKQFAAALAAFDEASGTRDVKHPSFVHAYSIWSQLAKDGDTRANYHMGMMNMFGLGGAEFEQSVGINNIRIAANGGYPIAQSFMGFLVESSDGSLVRTGDELALSWWRKGADGNHCAGIRRLAKAYKNGDLSLSADAAKAAEWEVRTKTCDKR